MYVYLVDDDDYRWVPLLDNDQLMCESINLMKQCGKAVASSWVIFVAGRFERGSVNGMPSRGCVSLVCLAWMLIVEEEIAAPYVLLYLCTLAICSGPLAYPLFSTHYRDCVIRRC